MTQVPESGNARIFFDSTDDFKLGDFINGINMVEPFGSVQVALMNRIHSNITGLARQPSGVRKG